MAVNPIELVSAIGKETSNEIDDAVGKINHCLGQLSDEQLWWRPAESMNSIGNLLLHLCGNLRQWIVSGVGGTPDLRERQKEFDERDLIPKVELIRRLDETVSQAKAVLAGATGDELLRGRRIQSFDVTGLQAILESVAHFRGHTQEIVHMTRCQLGDNYKFHFIPTREQGSPE